MRMRLLPLCMMLLFVFTFSCGTAYKAQPLAFKLPSAYPNAQQIAGAVVGARAFADADEAKEAFGFDIRGAGMLPVQIVFDNQGPHPLQVDPTQTFLEDNEGNLWPVLSSEIAYDRATRYAQTKEIFKKGAYHGFLGATAGALIGAAIGIVSGRDVAESAGKGAAVGAAGGGILGGVRGYQYDAPDARRSIIDDLQQKSLQNKAVEPKSISYGFIFFPGEALTARQLRLHIVEKDTGMPHVVLMNFPAAGGGK
ncbi:MAG: hypothetical protein ACOYW7_09805 [Nitrospirota bacterium]